MNKKLIDEVFMKPTHAIFLVFLSVVSISIGAILLKDSNGAGAFGILIGGGFGSMVWGLLHLSFRSKLTKLVGDLSAVDRPFTETVDNAH